MYRSIIASLCFLSASTVLAEMHEFRTPDGKSVQAEIVDFNAKLGKVTLKRQGGKRVKVNPSAFVEADQKYIKEWASLAGFRSESLFKISCKDALVEKWKETEESDVYYGDDKTTTEKVTTSESKFERHVFKLNFHNSNRVSLGNMKLEYRIFYEQDEQRQMGKISTKKKVTSGEIEKVQLRAQEKKTFETKPVILRDTDYMLDYVSGSYEAEKGDLKGIWLRVSCTTASGQTVTRNVFEPASLEGKYFWK